jgi:LysR family hydrogen peroxide-inducible transcriptional activator
MKDLNFSLKQLRFFLVSSRHTSLRQAARELKITQPSLSAQLKSLEEALGADLFERTRGGVVLTPMGRILLEEARRAVTAAEAIMEAANFAARGPAGTFKLGVTPSLGPYSLPWILPSVRKEFKMVKFFVREATTTELVEGLKSGTYDVIISPLPFSDPSFTVVPLFREPVCLVMHADHPLARKGTIRPDQLEGLEILTLEEQHLFFKQVEELCRKFNATVLRDYEGTSLDAIRQMAIMDMGVTFLPALYIRSEIKGRKELKVISIEGESIYRVHAMAWRNTSPLRGFFRNLSAFFQKTFKEQFGEDVILQ